MNQTLPSGPAAIPYGRAARVTSVRGDAELADRPARRVDHPDRVRGALVGKPDVAVRARRDHAVQDRGPVQAAAELGDLPQRRRSRDPTAHATTTPTASVSHASRFRAERTRRASPRKPSVIYAINPPCQRSGWIGISRRFCRFGRNASEVSKGQMLPVSPARESRAERPITASPGSYSFSEVSRRTIDFVTTFGRVGYVLHHAGAQAASGARRLASRARRRRRLSTPPAVALQTSSVSAAAGSRARRLRDAARG